MDLKQIVDSDYFKGFIENYFNVKFYSIYPELDRIDYLLCKNESEKLEKTHSKISDTKSLIEMAGYKELSSLYLLSCDPKNAEFISSEYRFDYWFNKFHEVYTDKLESLQPISKAWKQFSEDDDMPVEYSFWKLYPENLQPQIKHVTDNINFEDNLKLIIEDRIEEFQINKPRKFRRAFDEDEIYKWSFDPLYFKRYEKFVKPIEDIFNLSELLVQLERLQMLKDLVPFKEREEKETLIPNEAANIIKEKIESEIAKDGISVEFASDSKLAAKNSKLPQKKLHGSTIEKNKNYLKYVQFYLKCREDGKTFENSVTHTLKNFKKFDNTDIERRTFIRATHQYKQVIIDSEFSLDLKKLHKS